MTRARILNLYVGLLTAASFAAAALSMYALTAHPVSSGWTWLQVAILIPLSILSSNQAVYYSDSNRVLMGTVGQIATVMVLPLPLAVLVVVTAKAVVTLYRQLRKPGPLKVALVNFCSSVLAVSAGAAAFALLGGHQYLWQERSVTPLLAFPALLSLSAIYYSLDALVVSGAITLYTNDRFRSVLLQVTRDTFLPEVSLIAVGAVLAILLRFSPVLSLLVVVPVYISMRTFEAVARLRDETEKAVMHMARSVDLRDTGTGIHSQQLEVAARRLASALGLMPEHVHEIGLAARAHDLGKIEISDSILLKRGPLTPEERKVMEEHPKIGADMLANYSAFAKSVGYVRHHHERWDGRGYPDGLKGEEIPLGARIISVVDAFDAMTADRPYRKALGVDEAVSRLKADMGTQFDPRVCAAWIQLLIEDGIFVPVDRAPHLHLVEKEQAAG